jgi:hypothetical protein
MSGDEAKLPLNQQMVSTSIRDHAECCPRSQDRARKMGPVVTKPSEYRRPAAHLVIPFFVAVPGESKSGLYFYNSKNFPADFSSVSPCGAGIPIERPFCQHGANYQSSLSD